MPLARERILNAPLRLSDIKYSIYRGLRFDRALYAGWTLSPSIGLVAKDIDRLGLDIRSFRVPLARSVSEVMTRSIRENFDVGGRPPWEPLADYTVAVRGSSKPILVRSGKLRRIASQFNIWTITQTSATIRKLPSSVWYGSIHQAGYGSLMSVARQLISGSVDPRVRTEANVARLARQLALGTIHTTNPRHETKFVIPQRPFIMFQEQDVEMIQEIFAEWMESRADKVGRNWNRLI